MKGIILAAGKGTRLYPMTLAISKQLLPVYDKPMIYYPLAILLYANIKDILIIVAEDDLESYKKMLGDGTRIGVKISYKIQYERNGIAQSFIIAEDFIGNDDVCLILGDNIFYGETVPQLLEEAVGNVSQNKTCSVLGYKVKNPQDFGVAEFDQNKKIISIEEKPTNPKSNYAVSGLYFYTNDVMQIAKKIKPSARGEYEITDVNKEYLKLDKLSISLMKDDIFWFDAGSALRINEASNSVKLFQEEKNKYIACIEEIAYKKGYINKEQLRELGEELKITEYGKYLIELSK